MKINIEQGLIVSRRHIVKIGKLEADSSKAHPAHSVYSFCMAHFYNDQIQVPKELESDVIALGLHNG